MQYFQDSWFCSLVLDTTKWRIEVANNWNTWKPLYDNIHPNGGKFWFSDTRLLCPLRDVFLVWKAWVDYLHHIYSCLSLPTVSHSSRISTRKSCTCFSAVAREHRSYQQCNLQGKQGQGFMLTVPFNPAGGDDCKLPMSSQHARTNRTAVEIIHK